MGSRHHELAAQGGGVAGLVGACAVAGWVSAFWWRTEPEPPDPSSPARALRSFADRAYAGLRSCFAGVHVNRSRAEGTPAEYLVLAGQRHRRACVEAVDPASNVVLCSRRGLGHDGGLCCCV